MYKFMENGMCSSHEHFYHSMTQTRSNNILKLTYDERTQTDHEKTFSIMKPYHLVLIKKC